MKRCAVLIGVDRTGDLPELAGAARNAHDLLAWCNSQSIDSRLLSDENGNRVTIDDIKKAIASFDPRTYTQMIVYFAGHGILKAPDSEYWLLSGAPDDPDEAVNVPLSASYARYSGFKNVVFISDACRAIPDRMRLSGVLGKQVFPNKGRAQSPADIDALYATAPADPSFEVGLNDAMACGGIFTKDLLEGLNGVVQGIPEQSDGRWLVTARGLKPYLLKQVPLSVARMNSQYRQIPEVRPESSLPLFLAQLINFTPPAEGHPVIKSAEATRETPLELTESVREMQILEALSEDITPTEAAMNQVLAAKGREGFESEAGFTVVGADTVRTWTTTGACEHESDPATPSRHHIRVRGTGPSNPVLTEPGSVLIQFADGRGTMLAVWPGFVGTILVEGGRVVNVNYTPARNAFAYNEYKQGEVEIDRRRAYVAAAARSGRFRLDPQHAVRDAETLRHFKRFDPTLGLYAAYAYAQVGAIDQVESVLSYMQQDVGAVPFDVLLLCRKLRGSIPRVPFAPMLAQGWSLLDPEDVPMVPEIESARPHLVPSLWTTFEPKGTEALAELFLQRNQTP